jgi:hypothetical protein
METRQTEFFSEPKKTAPAVIVWGLLSSDIPLIVMAILLLMVLLSVK